MFVSTLCCIVCRVCWMSLYRKRWTRARGAVPAVSPGLVHGQPSVRVGRAPALRPAARPAPPAADVVLPRASPASAGKARRAGRRGAHGVAAGFPSRTRSPDDRPRPPVRPSVRRHVSVLDRATSMNLSFDC